MSQRLVGLIAAVAVLASTLVVVGAGPVPSAGAAGGGVVDLTDAAPATFDLNPGVEQLTVTGAEARSPLTLAHADSLERIVTLFTDDHGQLVFQYVPDDFMVHDPQTDGVLPTVNGSPLPPGSYRVVSEGVPGEPFEGPTEASDPTTVLAIDDHPDESLYDQVLPAVPSTVDGGVQDGYTAEDGYGYLEVRDGTLLSVNVRLPDPSLYGPGPYPTVVQYSGYAPSRPGAPGGADAGGMLAGLLGYAYVGVNVRGSGCSGGVFDTFNAAQSADGYDVIETVARQPWVRHGHVGMMGISYSGITQLYVAATNPPSLAAITPLSVIEDPWYQQWPGGIYNAGFTQAWLASRDDEALGGAQWVKDRVDGGDTTCASNLEIRSQNINFEEFARSLERRPDEADARKLSLLVRDIDVPVFLAGAWQDEQTGSRFGLMLDQFESVPAGQTTFLMYNGHHNDGFSPLTMSRWFEFLSFYVDRSVPELHPLVRAGAPFVFEDIFEVPGLEFEPDRFLEEDGTTPVGGDYDGTLDLYEAEAPVRVLFEVGASPDFPDHPQAHRQRYEMTFESWPPAQATAHTLYLGPDGTLGDEAPAATTIERFAFDADVLGTRYYAGGGHGGISVSNDWKVTADGLGLAYETPPLDEPLVVAGEGYVDLWFRSTGTDAPLEVVLSEVYAPIADPDEPEGPDAAGIDVEVVEEVRVQNGLLQAGYRTLDPDRSTGTQIDHLYFAADHEPLVPGQFVNLQVPLYSVAHAFREGSRLRIEINTPGGDAALWDFESDDFGATTHDVAHGGTMASALVLPALPDDPALSIPEAFAPQEARPDCDSLRGQPCREHQPMTNEVVHVSPPCDAGRFTDVGTTNPFCADITWLADAGITTGFDDGTFRPAGVVTRQATAAFLYRYSGEPDGPDPTCTEAPFSDVDTDHPFCGEIAWLADSGITTGFDDDTFRPAGVVTRQATAAFFHRLAGEPDGADPACTEAPFSDVDTDHPFCGEIAWLADSGITTGFDDGTFRPAGVVTRQATAAFFQRFRILTV
jgi:uncharacterized protein